LGEKLISWQIFSKLNYYKGLKYYLMLIAGNCVYKYFNLNITKSAGCFFGTLYLFIIFAKQKTTKW